MKEIKFRMWSKKANKYFYDPQNVYDCLKFSKMDETSILYEDLTWQQFTGEFDKNKKEIYEGDIVRVTSEEWGNENFLAEVIFSEASFLSKIDDNDIRGLWGGDDIEVVGSIFPLPCNPDHNGECLVCDCWLNDCPFNKENKD